MAHERARRRWSLTRRRGVIAGAVVLALAAGGLATLVGPRGDPPPAPTRDELAMAAMRDLQARSTTPVHIKWDGGVPVTVRAAVPVVGSNPTDKALDYFRQTGDLYGLNGAATALRANRVNDDRGGPDVVTFEQTYFGIPVLGAEVAVLAQGDSVLGTGGRVRAGIAIGTTPAIDEEAALAAVVASGGRVVGDPALRIFDAALFGRIESGEPRLVWKVRALRNGTFDILIDAQTGAELMELAIDPAEGEAELDIRSFLNNWEASDLPYCGDTFEEALSVVDPQDFEYGFAESYFERALEFYFDELDIWSWNGIGSPVRVRIDALIKNAEGDVTPNAHYSHGCGFFEFSDGWIHDGTRAYSDIAVHEFQHGVTAKVGGGLTYEWMSGAVNESYSDVLGMFVTERTDHLNPIGGRSLFDPNAFGDPDRWGERYSASTPCGPVAMDPCTLSSEYPDRGWVHSNSGIGNKIAYLLWKGGEHPDTGVSVPPIERIRLANIYIDALVKLPSVADYWTLRWALESVTAANAAELCSIRQAFAAAELGPGDADCDGTLDPEEDEDGDTILDLEDNCPNVPNPTQADLDTDGQGDACDLDRDGDGVPQSAVLRDGGDNCPDHPNTDQADADRDGVGSACDPTEDGDADDDLVPDAIDNCPADFNAKPQPDLDRDGAGDVCDDDIDGDGRLNANDNCVTAPNADQVDGDRDGIGDPCDACPTTADATTASRVDAYLDRTGAIGTTSTAMVADSDGDGVWDSCDRDVDGDGASIRLESGDLRPGPSGGETRVTITGEKGGVASVVVGLCEIVCDEPPPDCVEVRLSGVDDATRVSVVDDDGNEVARSLGDVDATLRYQPDGGSTYELVFALLGSTTLDEGIAARLDGCDPRGPAPTPGSTPGPAPSIGTPPLCVFTGEPGTAVLEIQGAGLDRCFSFERGDDVSPTTDLIAGIWAQAETDPSQTFGDIATIAISGQIVEGTRSTSQLGVAVGITVSRDDAEGNSIYYHSISSRDGECQVSMQRTSTGVSGTFVCEGVVDDDGHMLTVRGSFST